MSESDFQSIVNKIATMPENELKEIENRISINKSLKKRKVVMEVPVEEQTELKLFYKSISDGLFRAISFPKREFDFFKEDGNFKKLREAFAFVNQFLETALGTKLSRPYKLKGYYLFTKLMIKSNRTHPAGLSMSLILNCHQNFPGLVEHEFPGYIKNGHGKFIFMEDQNPNDLKL